MAIAALSLVIIAIAPLYFWNATYITATDRRGTSGFELSEYRFRQIAVLRWNAHFRGAELEEKVIFGATTVRKIERITWFDQNRALLLELWTTYDASPSERTTPLLIDFTNGQLLTTLSGLATDEQVAEALHRIQTRQ